MKEVKRRLPGRIAITAFNIEILSFAKMRAVCISEQQRANIEVIIIMFVETAVATSAMADDCAAYQDGFLLLRKPA